MYYVDDYAIDHTSTSLYLIIETKDGNDDQTWQQQSL